MISVPVCSIHSDLKVTTNLAHPPSYSYSSVSTYIPNASIIISLQPLIHRCSVCTVSGSISLLDFVR